MSEHFNVHILKYQNSNTTSKRKRNSSSSSSEDGIEKRILDLATTISQFLLQDDTFALNAFRRPGGVVLLVMSLVASRGTKRIASDMDDFTQKLTSQFGHCSQELINLLLTGQAVSNVFDNTMTPGGFSGSFTCRGIQYRPSIGYLTQLEALRYCEVGGFYKNPRFPIWVVGSTSHFTVLFGDTSCLKETKSDALLEKCRRAFKEVDGVDENGFISRLDLHKVYDILQLDIGGEHAVQTLAATLEVSGADIILWDDFWKATSRLMMGASLETVLNGEEQKDNNTNNNPKPPILAITENGEPPIQQQIPVAAALTATTKIESDEEMAKRLAAEWGSPIGNNTTASATSNTDVTMSSDEVYARKLQAQLDAEGGGENLSAIFGSDDMETQQAVAEPDDGTTATIEDEDKMMTTNDNKEDPVVKIIDDTNNNTTIENLEKFGNSFPLYHYNGLRGGTLTPFRVTRLTAEEAVGSSIALGNNGPNAMGAGGDLEDVIRTKWPSCMINWLGLNSAPYID